MLKKITIILFCLIFLSCGCTKQNNRNEYKGDTASGITMTLKQKSLTRDSAIIIINDINGSNKNAFSIEFSLYKEEKGLWYPLEYKNKNVNWELKRYFVDESGTLELKQYWEDLYGKLSKGKYKLVKYANNLENNTFSSFSTDFYIE